MGGKGRPQTLETQVIEKFMTAAVFAALVLTVGAMAATPFLRGPTIPVVAQVSSPERPPRAVNGSGDKQLSSYQDPHARKRNIATRTVGSCWVQTRYGTVDICETAGRGD